MAGRRRPSRRRRFVRAVAVTTFVTLVVQSNAEGAVAVGSTVDTQSPKALIAKLLDWVRGDDPPEVPRQERGSAEGRKHQVSAAETRAGGGRGRAPGKGRNQLDEDRLHRPDLREFKTGPGGVGFDHRTAGRRASMSTRNSDTFVDAAGRQKRVVSAGKVNYRTADGTYARVDTEFQADRGRYRQKANDLGVDVAAKADAPSFSKVTVEEGRAVGSSIEGASPAPAAVDGGTARYDNVFPGVDVELVSLEDGVKETFILRNADAPTRFRFPLQLTGLTARLSETGAVEYIDAEGKVAAFTPHGFMSDSNIDPRSGEGAWSDGVTYRLVQAEDGITVLEVALNRKWVRDPARKFPILVDPTTKTVSGDTYVDKFSAADRSTVATLAMGTYDNATHLARALFKFGTLANPPYLQYTTEAVLNVFLSYQGSCGSYPFEVRAVQQNFTVATTTTYPGPTALSPVLGTATPAPGAACSNSAVNPTVGVWVKVPLNPDYFNSWSPNNFGLVLKAPTNTGTTSWKRFSSEETTRKAFIEITYASNVVPQIDKQFPEHNATINTLRPEFIVTGYDPDNYPAATRYRFWINSEYGAPVHDSGLLANGVRSWIPPPDVLEWGVSYQWTVRAYDGQDYSALMPGNFFDVEVPEPVITSELAQNDRGYDPNVGSYTTTETDADVSTAGPPLGVTRAYNSRDPRRDGAFGEGWSTLYDVRLVEVKNAAGTLTGAVMTYPTGEQVGFALEPDGFTWTAPSGRYATLYRAASPDGGLGFELVDKAGTTYTLTHKVAEGVWSLNEIRDARYFGLIMYYNLGRLSQVSAVPANRNLYFGWAQDNPQSAWHVTSVTTDAAQTGVAESRLEWRYDYTGDRLVEVCGPEDDADNHACTRYEYADGSHLPTAVLDTNPLAYWRLGDTTGPTAVDAVTFNQGLRNGTYTNVALATADGPVASGGTVAAAFNTNGTPSFVGLASDMADRLANQSIGMWFRTAAAGGPGGVLYAMGSQSPAAASTTGWYAPVLYIGTDGKLRGRFYTGVYANPMESATTVNDGNWHYAALTSEAGTQRLYLDGAQVGTPAPGAATVVGNPVVSIGAGFIGGSYPAQPAPGSATGQRWQFTGQIADVAKYSRGLPAADIAAINATRAGAGLLSKITSPSDKTAAMVGYDIVRDAAALYTDANGGEWTLQAPVITGGSAGYRAKTLVSNPDAYWRLADRNATQAYDETRGGYYARLHNVTLNSVAGPFGHGDSAAAVFNGTSSWMESPLDISTGATQLALSLWFRTGPEGAGDVLYGQAEDSIAGAATTAKGFTPVLYIGTDGKLRGQFRNGTINPLASVATVTNNAWHHVVLTGSGSSQTLYLDGGLVGTRAGTLGSTLQTKHTIGAGYLGGTWPGQPSATATASYFSGALAEVAVHRYALTTAQINDQRKAFTTALTETPIKYVDVLDPGDHPSTYVYDPRHNERIVRRINTANEVTEFDYDEAGFLFSVRDPNGVEVLTGHDERGNLTSEVTCQNYAQRLCSTTYYTYFSEEYQYDLRAGRVKTERDGRAVDADDPLFVTSYTYTEDGQPLTVTSPPVSGFLNGRTTTTTYTTGEELVGAGPQTQPRGLVKTVTTPAGWTQTFTYYANGDPASVTTALGERTEFVYDNLGRLTEKTAVALIAGDAGAGAPQPARMSTTYEYNGRDQVTVQLEPVNRNAVTGTEHQPRTSYIYDVDGNILSETVADAIAGGDPPRVTSWTYDGANRIATTTEPENNARPDPGNHATRYEYNNYGDKVTETAPDGEVLRYTYDSERRPLTTTIDDYVDPETGSTADLVLESRAYDPAGRLGTITDAMGWDTRLTYTDNGLVAKVTRVDPNGEGPQDEEIFVVEDNDYDAAGNLRKKITDNGASSLYRSVDAADRLTSEIIDQDGLTRIIDHNYDADDRLTSTTSRQLNQPQSSEEVITASYSLTAPNPAKPFVFATETRTMVVDGQSRITTWELDNRGLPVTMADARNKVTQYFHDRAGNLVRTVAPAVPIDRYGQPTVTESPEVLYGYNTFGELVDSRDPNGGISHSDYDANGRAVASTAPAYTPPGQITPISAPARREFSDVGQLVREIDPLGRTTGYDYDQLGHLTQVTAPGDAVTKFTYTPNGDRISTLTPEGAKTTATFDYLQRQRTATSILRDEGDAARTTQFEYFETNGWLKKRTSPAGVSTEYTYNSAGLPVTITDGAGDTTSYVYDLRNRPIKVTRPDQTSSARTYNTAGELIATADYNAAGAQIRSTSATYNANGWLKTSTDARGYTTTFNYDDTGALIEQIEPVADGEDITTTFGYDPAGNQTRFTDGRGSVFWSTYNAWNLIGSQIEPATTAHPDPADRTWTFLYDANARPVGVNAPGGVSLTREFDDRGNLTRENGTGAEASTAERVFSWDKDDRLKSASAPDGTNTFTWNDRAQLRTTTGPSGNATFAYAPDGQMASRVDAAGTTTYSYDTAGRVAGILDASTGTAQTRTYQHGRLDNIAYGSAGPVRHFGYDPLQRVTVDTLTFPGGGTAEIDYDYDLNNNLIEKTTAGLAGPAANTYTYDRANRLKSWTAGTGTGANTTSYDYDASGNRTRAGAKTFTYDARNRLLTQTTPSDTTTYAYSPRGTLNSTATLDSGGQTVTRPVTFDAFDQMTSDGEVQYRYDALNRVVTAGPENAQQTFTYTGLDNDLASDGSATYSRDPAGGLLAVASGGAGHLTMTDSHDDVVAQFTATGTAVAGSTAYNPLGEVTARSGSALGRLGYQSEYTDPATGKVNMLSRWLDPNAGRFISRDTVTRSPSPASAAGNPYIYMDANPFYGTDPSGHGLFDEIKDMGGALVDGAGDLAGSVTNTVGDLANRGLDLVAEIGETVTNHVFKPGLGWLPAGSTWLGKNLVRYGGQLYRLYEGGTRWILDSTVKAMKRLEKERRELAQRLKKEAAEAFKAAQRKIAEAKKAAERARKKAAQQLKRAAEKAEMARAFAEAASAAIKQGFAAAAASDPVQFVKKHKAILTEVVIGAAAYIGCTAATSGAGAGACIYVAAAAGAAATEALYGDRSLKGLAIAAGIGILSAGVAGKAGAIIAKIGGRQALAAALKAAGPNTRAVVNSTMNALGRVANQAHTKGTAAAQGAATRFPALKPLGKPGCSFAAGTTVLLADGQAAAIESLEVGDQVLATDPVSRETGLRTVTAVHRHLDTALATLVVKTEHGALATIATTPNHDFWDQTTRSWVDAIDLPIGDALLTPDGRILTVAALTTYNAQRAMYDLTVDQTHTYYVMPSSPDDAATRTAVLVHNAGGETCGVGEYLAKKAPRQVTPGTRKLEGQYVNDRGRVEPWVAHYDEYGRQVGRTDYNAGNRAAGIPDTHYHRYEYGPGRNGEQVEKHVPGEFPE